MVNGTRDQVGMMLGNVSLISTVAKLNGLMSKMVVNQYAFSSPLGKGKHLSRTLIS